MVQLAADVEMGLGRLARLRRVTEEHNTGWWRALVSGLQCGPLRAKRVLFLNLLMAQKLTLAQGVEDHRSPSQTCDVVALLSEEHATC